jgi:hypothetical protein
MVDTDVRTASPLPINPLLSKFPAPMTAAEARREARRARRRAFRLPDGHPYAILPSFVPVRLAAALERARLGLALKRSSYRFRLKD